MEQCIMLCSKKITVYNILVNFFVFIPKNKIRKYEKTYNAARLGRKKRS